MMRYAVATPQSSRFRRMRSAASPSDSMKTTSRDPRLNASKPTAPVPAKTSKKTVPETVGPRISKRVSLRRSLVGRSRKPRGPRNFLPRNFPEITRIKLKPRGSRGWFSLFVADEARAQTGGRSILSRQEPGRSGHAIDRGSGQRSDGTHHRGHLSGYRENDRPRGAPVPALYGLAPGWRS